MNIKHKSQIEGLDDDLQAFDIIEDIRWNEIGKTAVLSYYAWIDFQWAIYDFKQFIEYLTR
jgi:hypothetical protein